jgi:hypothetical protein
MAPLVITASEAAESSGLSAVAVGVLAMSAFIFLLLVTFAFRSVGSRHQGH